LSLLGTNLSFLRWEALANNDTMKYGSRCYIKGVPKSEEKILGHIVHTLEGNAKRLQMGQGVAAATKKGGKRGQRVVAVSSPVVVAKGRKGQGVAAATTKQGGGKRGGRVGRQHCLHQCQWWWPRREEEGVR